MKRVGRGLTRRRNTSMRSWIMVRVGPSEEAYGIAWLGADVLGRRASERVVWVWRKKREVL